MTSFIVIGLNEGWRLTKCLESIFSSIKELKVTNYEVIYVDSRSKDDSILRAQIYSEVKIIQLTGDRNAAIARNAGAKESKGKVLVFLDGDMEILPEFLRYTFNLGEREDLFVSGQLVNYFYDDSDNLINEQKLFRQEMLNKFDVSNGGAFIISKHLWELVGGMRTKYERSEDIDLNYRLAKRGYRVYRSDIIIVRHHTIQYDYNISLKGELTRIKTYYFRGLLIRDHLFNSKIIYNNLRINYSLFFLLLAAIIACILKSFYIIGLYMVVIGLRSWIQFRKNRRVIATSYLSFFLKYIYQDIVAILSAFFYFPKKKTTIYKVIN